MMCFSSDGFRRLTAKPRLEAIGFLFSEKSEQKPRNPRKIQPPWLTFAPEKLDRLTVGVLLLDHQDSFTYNLAELISEVSSLPLTIVPSSEWHPDLLEGKKGVILSPGPMRPKDHPGLFPCIAACTNRNVPLLGVCLGHQGIGEFFGARLTRLPQVIHGRKKTIQIQPSSPLFAGIPQAMEVGLYHSWMLDKGSITEELDIIGLSAENEIMAVQHREKPIFGIQFHPESFLSPTGAQLMRNFIRLCS